MDCVFSGMRSAPWSSRGGFPEPPCARRAGAAAASVGRVSPRAYLPQDPSAARQVRLQRPVSAERLGIHKHISRFCFALAVLKPSRFSGRCSHQDPPRPSLSQGLLRTRSQPRGVAASLLPLHVGLGSLCAVAVR